MNKRGSVFEQSAEEFWRFVVELKERWKREEEVKRGKRREVWARRNRKGSLIVTLKRKPKVVYETEFLDLCQQGSCSREELIEYLRKRGITLMDKPGGREL